MLKETVTDPSTADKILQAALKLFATNDFNGVSIKDIARLSGVNSALISYYFGGKQQLYQQVLDMSTELFIKLINKVNKKKINAADKLCLYVQKIAAIERTNDTRAQLVFKEVTNPSGVCNEFVKSKLLKIHDFLLTTVENGQAFGKIKANLDPSHVAFTLESIISFFFLTKHLVSEDKTYLSKVLDSYLTSVIKA